MVRASHVRVSSTLFDKLQHDTAAWSAQGARIRRHQPPEDTTGRRLSFEPHGMHGAWEAKRAQLQRLDLRPLGGLRALACLGILAAHLMYWVGAAHPDKHAVRQAPLRRTRFQPLQSDCHMKLNDALQTRSFDAQNGPAKLRHETLAAQVYAYLSAHPWAVAPLNISEPAMDMFLVLTGFLAALSLVPALEAAASPGAVVARRAAAS